MSKYVRRTIAFVLTAVFLVALVICAGVVLSVKNVNVSYVYYTDTANETYQKSVTDLQTLKGGSILFVDEDTVTSCIADKSKLSVSSFKKVFPCSIDIVLTQRVETFWSEDGDRYNVYDGEGKYMDRRSQLAASAGTPCVLLNGEMTSSVRENVAKISKQFKQKFGALGGLVNEISVVSTPEFDNVVFYLGTGLRIEITDYLQATDAKIDEAYLLFNELSDDKKTIGKIYCFVADGDVYDVNAVYMPIS